MNDTHPRIEKKLREMMALKTPAERVEMGCRMFDFSKAIVKSSILASYPNISPTELRQKIFLRFYGNDFETLQRNKILAWIASK